MSLKSKIVEAFLYQINDKIGAIETSLQDINEAVEQENKSTAGDKHETSLAMLQIEQSNIAKQLQDTIDQKIIFEKIQYSNASDYITSGSLIQTNKGYYYMSIALRKIEIEQNTVFALSPFSPLGEKLMGLKINETTELNGIQYKVLKIE